jgi:ATP-dependent helicase HrpB
MLPLPIDPFLPQIVQSLKHHPSLVLVAPPGAGKTTRIPPALVNGLPGIGNLVMLQPRRVAARAAAQRIAEEQGFRLGEEVGYHIRFEKRYMDRTRIRIFTEAILTRMLLQNPCLESRGGGDIGAVVLDEFHERHLHTDLALAFLREIQQTVRPELKLVVMSATLDARPVSAFLGDCPIIVTEGRSFPVEISYHPARDPLPRVLETHLSAIIEQALDAPGDLLVFLPGVGEIERVRRALAGPRGEGLAVLPLHGSLSQEEQERALRPDAAGRRKVVLATNIAETSLTIDGVRTVIDTGMARIASFDPQRGMDRLDLARISRASAAQRSGRAGRQAPGRALRLWSEQEQKHLAEFNVPEIARVDLSGALLAVHAWSDPTALAWFEAPPPEMLAAAEELLQLLGALQQTGRGRLTDIGTQMLQVPAHPRIARLLLAAHGTPLLGDALTLAAILADESRGRTDADPLAALHRPPPQVATIRAQLEGIVRHWTPASRASGPRPATLQDLLLLAYPDRLARRRGADPHAAVMVGGIGLRLAPAALTPAIVAAPLLLALDARHDPRNQRSESIVHVATPIDESALERLFSGVLRSETSLAYDAAREKVIAWTRRYFRDLVLAEDPHGHVDPEASGKVLAAALADRATELFLNDERAARLLARVALLRHYLPQTGGPESPQWPAFDDAQLRELLTLAAAGKKSLQALTEEGVLARALESALPYPLDRLLDQQAPATIEVPSGSRIALAYGQPASPGSAPPAPVLAVRLQELFGLLETPRIAAGRVPVVLHLLSPGYKPIQITSDLRSFWSSAYFEVRKDLRTRYPKHKWPEDPLTAAPEAKGRRR